MRFSLTIALLAFVCGSLHAQYGKLLGGGQKPNVTFYADAARTEPITKLTPGQTEFYVVTPLNKKHFKFPLGKFAGFAEFNQVPIKAEVVDLKSGYSTKDVQIYYAQPELTSTLSELANGDGEVMVKFKIDDDINFIRNVEKVVESGNNTYQLSTFIGNDDEPIGYGVLEWDLTDGGQAFKEAALASRANYTFSATDDHNDEAFKAAVKADIERRINIKIYQMAHGDRVPYTRDLSFYRRNQIGMTYKDLDDGKCYTGGISAFEDGAGPNGPYTYDNQGTISQGDQIPCDRVDK